MYTQCPTCHTVFRITEQQLSVAKGKVRCGQCNLVYNARGTLSDSPGGTPPAETKPVIHRTKEPAQPTSPGKLASKTQPARTTQTASKPTTGSTPLAQKKTVTRDSPDIVLPDNIEDDEWQVIDLGDNQQTRSPENWQDAASLSTTPDITNRPTEKSSATDNDSKRYFSQYMDDDIAEELSKKGSASDILSEIEQQLTIPEDIEVEDDISEIISQDFEDSWLNATSDLDELDELDTSPTTPSSNKSKPSDQTDLFNSTDKSLSFQAEPDDLADEDIVLETSKHTIGQHDVPPKREDDDTIPLRLRNSFNMLPDTPRSFIKWAGIIVSIICLTFALATQVILFRSTEIANAYPESQPWLIKACDLLPCRDASLRATDQIQLANRNINQHPKQKSALLIKATIINSANFPQRYPDIQITFSSLTGKKVAQRIFSPADYLGSLYQPFLQMKPGKPTHIALEILDPGTTAINFEFKFL